MFKKLCFHWFSKIFNLGYVVAIPEDHTLSIMGNAWVWINEDQLPQASRHFLKSIEDMPIGRWLRQHRPHQIKLKYHQDWGHSNSVMEWYQYPRYRVELDSIRFYHASDAISFKLGFV